MLSVAHLTAAAAAAYCSVMSPSVNPCIVRVKSSAASPMTGPTRRYRNDPYNAKVLMSPHSLAAYFGMDVQTAFEQQPAAMMAPPMRYQPEPAAFVQSVAPVATTPVKRAAAAPTAAANAPRYALIAFKQEAGVYLAPFRVSVGDRVVVDGDRGEHVGTVQEITAKMPAAYDGVKTIVRRCHEKDLAAVAAKTQKEAAAVRSVQALVDTLGLSKVVVHDTELQFDGQKLTIYVRRPSPKTFVDFRKLQRGLFREFRCRIWLAYMDEVEVERPTLA